MIKTPRRFKTRPSLAILETLTCPVPKIIALGIVATGSMKAQLALRAAGIMKSLGSRLADTAAAPRMGINRLVVAVLEVISVRKVTSKQIPTNTPSAGRFSTPDRAEAIDSLRPDCLNP